MLNLVKIRLTFCALVNVIQKFMASLEARVRDKIFLERKDDVVDLLNSFLKDEGLKQKTAMPILRHVLTGRKVY